MSTVEETPVAAVTDDLDAFSSEFFGQKSDAPPQASEEEVEAPEAPAVSDAPEDDDTHDDEVDDTLAPDETEDEEEDEAPVEEVVKPKRNRAQERIEELNTKYREEQRQRELLEARLAKLEQTNAPEVKPEAVVVKNAGPQPDDLNDDGTDKYSLGEFDPTYIRDLTRHTLQEEREAMKVQEQATVREQALESQKNALQSDWQEKLGPAQERYPDFQEKGQELISSFDGIDQTYGEYLTATIMSLDYGTDVLYYLANHPDEAKTIVASGPTKATVSLGRIEAKFANAEAEKQLARPKISQAPTPPAHVNRGSAPAKVSVSADTDDLDAFSSEFFKKKGRK